jgi:NAD-dependent deacetylase
METSINSLREALKNAERVAVLTGAGVSAESGVPTFRGANGLWKNYQTTDLATPEAFSKDPELVWQFYNWRRGLIGQKTCNPAHTALAELERLIPDFTLITQNVDGLHLLAEINLERTPNSDLMDIVLIGKAGEILPGLVEGWA